ncbi:MAG: sulfatase [Planctomycetes bacterium]|nr:sulfatase [Planctomycetota bacterium]NUQ33504.1 sulfatase [Planctomycetaceae bacterium]
MTESAQPSRAVHRIVALCVLLIAAFVIGIYLKDRHNGPDKPLKPASQARPDVILISISGLRACHLSCYGYVEKETPEFDRLAAQSVLFERCFTPCPLCLPAHTSMLSGILPLHHRVRDDGMRIPEQGLTLLPEVLAQHGYQCAAFVNAPALDVSSGLNRGFHHYDGQWRTGEKERGARGTFDGAERWLRSQAAGTSSFLFLQINDLRPPFGSEATDAHKKPQDYLPEEIIPLYNEDIAALDRQLGKFIARLRDLGRFENSLIILTADHGTGLGDNSELTNGFLAFDSTTHVPLLIHLPRNEEAGRRTSGVVQTVDIVPTVLSGVAVAVDESHFFHGRDLRPVIDGSLDDKKREAYIECFAGYERNGWGIVRALRRYDDLIVFSANTPEYYRMDYPEAIVGPNLLEDFDKADKALQDVSREARARIVRHLDDHGASPLTPTRPAPMALHPERMFEAMDTVNPSRRDSIFEDRDAKPAKSMSDAMRQFQRAELLLNAGDLYRARDALQALLSQYANHLDAIRLLAHIDHELAAHYSGEPERMRQFIDDAAFQYGRAVVAAESVKRDALALHFRAAELFDQLRLGQYETVRSKAEAKLAEHGNEGERMETSVRAKFLWLKYVAAYKLNDRPDKRVQIGVLFDQALGPLASSFAPLIEQMRKAEPVLLAPMER